MTEKHQERDYIIQGKLAEKEKEIEELKQNQDRVQERTASLEKIVFEYLFKSRDDALILESKREKERQREEEESNEIIKFPANTTLAAKLNQEKKNNKNKLIS